MVSEVGSRNEDVQSLDFFNADYCSMISIMKDIDWSFLCQNSLSVEMFWSKISNVL